MNSPSQQYLPRISLSQYFHCRDDGSEPPVPHPDPQERGGQVPRGGERDPAVRDQHHQQQQEEENPPPHRIRRVRGALQHDASDASVRDGASE